ncbi:lipase family protein [Flavobacterium sp. MXW15]|uniref:Lipase family protein n=1 Tax=Xanthomonas chitinilytica TaxID=2989819 RepID=A0ABT3JS15_9XANT|nr:lipase family protein [Xanthomonas sp. H13-6]MCW4453664.1 lipase family protein [Flavobacterium sp. MXW15]MCW4471285.1 lipase family protein [Xanthomonas sp. H13-6]
MSCSRLKHVPTRFSGTLAGLALSAVLPLLGTAAALLPGQAQALDCGTNNGYTCQGTASQYAGGFNPGVGHGGFGGGNCSASRTPVVFIHGNGDSAISFDMPPGAVTGYTTPPRSVYDELKASGYNDCELFGVTYLDADERAYPQFNYHEPATYQVLKTFIDKVKAYTGKSQVDIVAHSLGSSMALAMIKYHGYQGSVRRFVNIAGGLRGLQTCRSTGYQSAYAPTCNAEAYVYPYNHYTFGLYPSSGVTYFGYNRWTGSGAGSLRTLPASYSGIRFYTITAGLRDQVQCFTTSYSSGCSDGALFNGATNVIAQVDIGAGSSSYGFDWNWSDGSPYNLGGGDTSNGVGHFRSKNNAGRIVANMLTTQCSIDCASGYGGVHGPAVNR